MTNIKNVIKENEKYINEIINIIESSHSFLCELNKIEDADYVYSRYRKLTNFIDNKIDDLLYAITGIYSDNEDAFRLFWFDWNSKESLPKELIRVDIIDGVKTFIESIEDE